LNKNRLSSGEEIEGWELTVERYEGGELKADKKKRN